MFKIMTNARTVRVQELKVEKRNAGTPNEFDAKSILFTVASNRPYSVVKKDANGVVIMQDGQPVKERPSDFILCKATGNLAQTIADHCSSKKAIVGGEQTISRFLSLEGHLETYKSLKPVKLDKIVNIAGKDYKIEFDTKVEVDASIFVVSEIVDFLDSKPVTTAPSKPVEETIKISEVGANTGAPAVDTNVQLNNNAEVVGESLANVGEGYLPPAPNSTEDCPF